MYDYMGMIDKMRNPTIMKQGAQEISSDIKRETIGTVSVDGKVITECKGYGEMNVLRYNVPDPSTNQKKEDTYQNIPKARIINRTFRS